MGARLASRVGVAGVRKRFLKSLKSRRAAALLWDCSRVRRRISEMDMCHSAKCRLI